MYVQFYARIKPSYNSIGVLKNVAIDPPVKKPTGFDIFEVLGVFPVLNKTDLFHKCSIGKLN